MIEEVKMKICPVCKEELPLDGSTKFEEISRMIEDLIKFLSQRK